MKTMVFSILILFGQGAFAENCSTALSKASPGGLPGVKSGVYTGINEKGGKCELEITRSQVHFTFEFTAAGQVGWPYSRRSFQFNEALNAFEHINYEFGKIRTLIKLDSDGQLKQVTFNENGHNGVKEHICSF